MGFLDGLEKSIENKNREDNQYIQFMESVDNDVPAEVVKKCIETLVDDDLLSKEIFSKGIKKWMTAFIQYSYEFEFRCNISLITDSEQLSKIDWISRKNGIGRIGPRLYISNIKQTKPIYEGLISYFTENHVTIKNKECVIYNHVYYRLPIDERMFVKRFAKHSLGEYKQHINQGTPIAIALSGLIKCDKNGKIQ